jgi:hypothetical protein
MITVEERSMLAVLHARRAVLQRELSQVDREIRQTEQAQARLKDRIMMLVRRPCHAT